MTNESIADRLIRENKEKQDQQIASSRQLATFIESAIPNVIPRIEKEMREGLAGVFDTVAPFELLTAPHGQRWLSMHARSKSNVRGAIRTKIRGTGPIKDNPHELNFTVEMEGEIEIPGRAQRQFGITPSVTSPQPVPSAQFIAETFESHLRHLLGS